MKHSKIYIVLFFATVIASLYIYISNNNASSNSKDEKHYPYKINSSSKTENNYKILAQKEFLKKEPVDFQSNLVNSSAIPTDKIANNNDLPYRRPSLQRYSEKMPIVFQLNMKPNQSVDYNLPADTDENNIAYFKKLSDGGDPFAKALYANRLTMKLKRNLYEDHLIKGDQLDVSYWRAQLEEAHKLLIESAVAGNGIAALLLADLSSIEVIQDRVDSLSWALIADQINGNGDAVLATICAKLKEKCTDDALAEALDMALFYLDFYDFRVKQKAGAAEK